jgi:DNA-binding CsgD family transcriptional regulator
MKTATEGFLLMQESLKPIYANDEAIAILVYPEKPANIDSMESFLITRVQSILGDKQSSIESGVVTQLVSGKRRYLCRAFPLRPGSPKSGSVSNLALLIERYPTAPFDISVLAQQYHLTEREQEAITYLLQGLTSKEIAAQMKISPNTVKAFLRLVMVKMGATTRSGIVGRIFTAQHEPRPQRSASKTEVCID